MREDRSDPKHQCEVMAARHVEDSIGYLCEKTAKQECDDCGAAICGPSRQPERHHPHLTKHNTPELMG